MGFISAKRGTGLSPTGLCTQLLSIDWEKPLLVPHLC